jgi:hypothetical protein
MRAKAADGIFLPAFSLNSYRHLEAGKACQGVTTSSPQSRRGEPKQKGPEYDEQEGRRLCQVCQEDGEIRTGVICMAYRAGSSTDVLGLDDRPMASNCNV